MDEFFVGQFEHSLDAKGRIVLPASFRAAFENSGFLIKGSEACLALMTPGQFADLAREMSSRSKAGDARQRAAKRSFGAGAARVLPDKQGRIAIPEELRQFAGLERECMIIGSIDEVEIWDARRWLEINAEGETVLQSPDEFRSADDPVTEDA